MYVIKKGKFKKETYIIHRITNNANGGGHLSRFNYYYFKFSCNDKVFVSFYSNAHR